MDPGEYRDARWYALVRAAVDLGVPEEAAPALVQQVLDRNVRRIRRAEDPDPLVHEALREAALGPPPAPARRRRWPTVALVGALVAVGVAVALTRPDGPPTDRLDDDQVPSLFGYDGEAARTLLEARGLEVELRPRRACEVLDRVLGSIPPAGAPYDRGDGIVVYTSLPADVDCLSNYTDRETAWRLLDFANGRGPAPDFAGPTSAVADDVLDALRDASAAVALVDERPLTYSLPAIRVTGTDTGGADAFTLLIRPPGGAGDGLRVDVYRDAGAIERVTLYRSAS